MGLIDDMDRAIDRYNDSLAYHEGRSGTTEQKWEAYEALQRQIRGDIKKLEDTYRQVIANPSIDLVEELNLSSNHRKKLIDAHEEEFLKIRKQRVAEINELKAIGEMKERTIREKSSEIDKLRENIKQLNATITRLQADQFKAFMGDVTPLRKQK